MQDGQDVPQDFASASAIEWWLADGLGGYAAGTASGAPARRSHVLLAAASPHGALTAVVQRFEEKLVIGSSTIELSAAHQAGKPSREGAFAQLETFRDTPWPRWRWRIDDVVIERSIRLVDGHNALVASWRLVAGTNVRLSVAPLLTARDPLARMLETPEFRGASQGIPGRVRFETLPGAPQVTLWHNGAFLPARGWSKGLLHPLDDMLDAGDSPVLPEPTDEAFLPGWIQALLAAPGSALHVVLSTEEALFRSLAAEQRLGTPPAQSLHDCIAALERGAIDRRAAWNRRALAGADLTARQAAAAHGGDGERIARRSEPLVGEGDRYAARLSTQLLDAMVRRHGRLTLAGEWPDATERGSDVLRAAAALVTVRAFEPAREIARGYLDYLDEGLAPESFDPATGLPVYGDPEPSLWLVNLVDLIARRASPSAAQEQFLREVAWPALEGVLQHLRMGSRHGVRSDRDGLLWCGEGANARARAGTNALWYHALVAMAQLGKILGRRENAAFYLAWAHELQRCYPETFWDDDAGCLFESLTANGPVRGLSPSQLWAVCMPPSLLPLPLARRLLATIDMELLEPRGLRERPGDGTPAGAWLGAWASSTLRAHERDAASLARVRERFARFDAAARAGWPVPQESERSPRSVLAAAELLRAWVEDGDRAESPGALIAI